MFSFIVFETGSLHTVEADHYLMASLLLGHSVVGITGILCHTQPLIHFNSSLDYYGVLFNINLLTHNTCVDT